jgi:hypothetical protein
VYEVVLLVYRSLLYKKLDCVAKEDASSGRLQERLNRPKPTCLVAKMFFCLILLALRLIDTTDVFGSRDATYDVIFSSHNLKMQIWHVMGLCHSTLGRLDIEFTCI